MTHTRNEEQVKKPAASVEKTTGTILTLMHEGQIKEVAERIGVATLNHRNRTFRVQFRDQSQAPFHENELSDNTIRLWRESYT